jgi:2-succinyl-5-enolpyruvyl-6-hydroxy-3-cyclohexene-1-carboxylate synthase
MNTAALNATYCATLVDEWAHQGLRHAVVAPGSRSAPLALALLRDDRIAVEVVLDERSAAFTALGIGRATGRPALVLCTSGTAATHFHAAVAEAHHAAVPLLVVTADRPPELHGIGAAQTIDQGSLYGDALRLRCDPGPPEADAHDSWRTWAAEAYAATIGRAPGPVHVNLMLREPLVGGERGAPVGTPCERASVEAARVDDATVRRLVEQIQRAKRGVIVVGWGAGVSSEALDRLSLATGWPVLADAIANARDGDRAVRNYEALVRVPELADELRPDMVLRFGAALTSKVTTEWLAPIAPHMVIDPHDLGIDPTRSVTDRIVCDPEWLVAQVARASFDPDNRGQTTHWATGWLELDGLVGGAVDAVLDGVPRPTGPWVAREVARSLPTGAQLVVASSMPVRDLEWFGGRLAGVTAHANRGVNGIDGTIATALGVAIATKSPTVAVVGDLAFLHDAGSLLGLAERDVHLTIVVVDNDGGGIFSFLAQREHTTTDEFERLFGTPQHADITAIARAYGLPAERAETIDSFRAALGDATTTRGVRVIVVPVLDRDADVAHHRDLWAAAANAVATRA